MYDMTIKARQDDLLELAKAYKCGAITVPKGYLTLGLPIPFLLRWALNRYEPKYLPAAFVYSMLTDRAKVSYNDGHHKIARREFNEALFILKEMLGIADNKKKLSFKAKVILTFAKLYIKVHYPVNKSSK